MPKFFRYCLLFVCFVLVICGSLTLFHSIDDASFVVVLDAGHGGDDPGAAVGETYEKNINLAIALLVQEQLEAQENVIVKMTRTEDTFISLSDRAAYANDTKADLFVSIHANALENDESFSGIFSFYHPKKNSSKKPAKAIQKYVSQETDAIDRGVRSENYAVLRETKMPAVLVETGFMTCPEELAHLVDSDYQKKLAKGIAQGVLEYINQ